MSSDEEFKRAACNVFKLKSRPTDDELLQLYALFMQATIGDVNKDRPINFLNHKGRAKWDAWQKQQGVPRSEAQDAYVQHYQLLVQQYGLSEQ